MTYAYHIVTRRAGLGALARSLARHLDADDSARLLAAVAASSSDPMRHLVRDELGAVVFSFVFAPDEALVAYGGGDWAGDPAARRSPVALGYVFSSLDCGELFAHFRGMSATSGMSRTFRDSPEVRATFADIGREAGALLVALDREDNFGDAVWPRAGQMEWPYELDNGPEDGPGGVDQYCCALLDAAGAGCAADLA